MAKRGRDFEEAVFRFVSGLDEKAVVKFDCHVPDRDTGAMRQVDVLVRCKVAGNHPITIIISCKDHRRPLDVGEVETFLSEIRSTSATTGVLYSRGGFTANALTKAKAHNVSCCRLFDNTPPELPSELLLSAHVAFPAYTLIFRPLNDAAAPDLLWRDVLATRAQIRDAQGTVLELLFGLCFTIFDAAIAKTAPGQPDMGPSDVTGSCVVNPDRGCPPIKVDATVTWEWFEGTFDAFRLRGAMNATTREFTGSTTIAPFPLHHTPAAPVWRRCQRPLPEAQDKLRIVATALGFPTPAHLSGALAGEPVFRVAPWVFAPPTAEQAQLAIAQMLAGSPTPNPVLQPQLTLTLGSIAPNASQ